MRSTQPFKNNSKWTIQWTLLALTALHISESTEPDSSEADGISTKTLNRMNRISERMQAALAV